MVCHRANVQDSVLGREQSLHFRRDAESTHVQSCQEGFIFNFISGPGDDCVGCMRSPVGQFVGFIHIELAAQSWHTDCVEFGG